ncbi:hypothetical protein ACV33W_16895 [Pseudomonas aeruginosa]
MLQPAFTSDGEVVEYVVRTTVNPRAAPGAISSPSSVLKGAMKLFVRHGRMIPFSLSYSPPAGILCPLRADVMYQDLGLRAANTSLQIESPAAMAGAAAATLSYPANLIIFTVPLSDALCDRSRDFARFDEFRPRLRVSLMPLASPQQRSDSTAVRLVGIQLHMPRGISDSSRLQSQFRLLLDYARASRLAVITGGADLACDYWWMRQFDRVHQYGDLLSPTLSADCLDAMLQLSNPSWREFRISGNYRRQDAALTDKELASGGRWPNYAIS